MQTHYASVNNPSRVSSHSMECNLYSLVNLLNFQDYKYAIYMYIYKRPYIPKGVNCTLWLKGRIVQPPKTGLKCTSAAAPTLQQTVACQSSPLTH